MKLHAVQVHFRVQSLSFGPVQTAVCRDDGAVRSLKVSCPLARSAARRTSLRVAQAP